MYSFYGGRPGQPFILVKAFPTEQAMKSAFSQGSAYTEVHYDEHVIINTDDKHDPTNGNIYRRGYDFTNANGGAEYVGNIAGPAGAPGYELTQQDKQDIAAIVFSQMVAAETQEV